MANSMSRMVTGHQESYCDVCVSPGKHDCRRTTKRFFFGRFRVLVRTRELLADGAPVALGSRAFEVLMALMEARGTIRPSMTSHEGASFARATRARREPVVDHLSLVRRQRGVEPSSPRLTLLKRFRSKAASRKAVFGANSAKGVMFGGASPSSVSRTVGHGAIGTDELTTTTSRRAQPDGASPGSSRQE